MGPVPNPRVLYKAVPKEYPIPNEHLVYEPDSQVSASTSLVTA